MNHKGVKREVTTHMDSTLHILHIAVRFSLGYISLGFLILKYTMSVADERAKFGVAYPISVT